MIGFAAQFMRNCFGLSLYYGTIKSVYLSISTLNQFMLKFQLVWSIFNINLKQIYIVLLNKMGLYRGVQVQTYLWFIYIPTNFME